MNQLTKAAKTLAAKYNSTSLILRIAIGLVVGSVLALICPGAAWIEEFGNLFVGALKGVAPVLVFVIVASALAQGSSKLDRRFGTVVWLYMLTTFVAAALSVVTSKLFPQTLVLAEAATADVVPQGLGDVMHTLLSNIVSNPVASIMNGNYIGILMWACLFGLAMKSWAAIPPRTLWPTRRMQFLPLCGGSSTWRRLALWAWCLPTCRTTACPSLPSMGACYCCWWAPCC